MLNNLKSRRALGGESMPKIAPISNSPQLSHLKLKNPLTTKRAEDDEPLSELRRFS
jgi:hypothetical protein